MRWSARSVASTWVCAWDHTHSNTRRHKRPRAPLHNSACRAGAAKWFCLLPLTPGPSVLAQTTRKFACSRAIRLGPADRHSYTATDLSGGHDCRKTPVLGGSFHQFWFDTHHPDPLLQAMGPTPGTPGPSVVVQETRKMALCLGRSRWTPTDWVTSGRSRMEGAPCEGTRHVRGSFYGTLTFGHTLGWPQLSGAPFTGHSAMGPYSKWRVINRVCQLNKVGRRH